MPYELLPVSIVMACREEADTIESCIASLLGQQDLPADTELVVADGLSQDGTREALARLAQVDPRLKIIDNPTRTTAAGLNGAIRASRGSVILRVDAHTEYAPDYVRTCLAALAETRADNVGGPARTRGESFLERAVRAGYHSSFAVGGARFHQEEYEGWVDTVPYGCWRRELFERIGFFDEELVRNQDDEHNLRIVRSGGRIWQSPRIRSWYRPRGSLSALFRQYAQYGYWKVRLIQKRRFPASPRHLVPGAFLLTLLAIALGGLISERAALFLAAVVTAYAVFVLGASVVAAARWGWDLLPVLPAVFACFHFGYGYGSLRGVVDFVVLRRTGRASFGALTREQRTG